MRVIIASDIHELIGLLWKDQRDYVIRKHSLILIFKCGKADELT